MSRTTKILKTMISAAAVSAIFLAPATAQLVGENRKQEVKAPQLIAQYAQRVGVAAEHLAWANGVEPTSSLSEGEELLIPARLLPEDPPEDGAVVNLAERGMYLFDDGEYIGFFPLSIGMESKEDYHTPTGEFKVVSRVENPDWTAPDSDWAEAMEKDRIDADSEENPLGEYWFGFDAPEGGYGFHENTAPLWTGDAVSHGCLRLYPVHAKMIHDQKLLVPGDTVRVVNQPVRLHQSDDGKLYLAVFPATYGKDDLSRILSEELQERHIELLDRERIEELTEDPDGVPRAVLDSQASIAFPSGDTEKALLTHDSLVMPANLARLLGLEVAYNGEERSILLSTPDHTERLPLDGDNVYRWGDSTYLDARHVLEAFSLPYRWEAERKTLVVGGAL